MLKTIIVAITFVATSTTTLAITIEGSSALAKPVKEAVESYAAKDKVKVKSTNAAFGFSCVRDGSCDIGMVSKDLSSSERSEFEVVHLGWDALAFIVHPSNSQNNITKAQIKEIFCGTLDNWKTLSGKTAPIIVYNRSEKTGPIEEFRTHFCEPNTKKISSSGSFVYLVSLEPNSITYVGYGQASLATDKVKILSYEDNMPNPQNIQRGKYPLIREVSLIYKKGRTDKELLDVIKHIQAERVKALPKFGLVPTL